MDNSIVGVRYIGKKPMQEDTVCKTGAVWLPGQTHNFGAGLAKRLLAHTDSFDQAPVSIDGQTYLTHGKQAQKSANVAAFVNLTGMDVDQMVLFSKREFGRTVQTEGKDEAQVRREVHALMTNQNLDDEADRRQTEAATDNRRMVPFFASPEEYEALMAGQVVLKLIPAELILVDDQRPESVADTDPPGGPESGDAEPPTLKALLAGLEKTGLIKFAHQESVAVSNAMTAEKLREKIENDLLARAGLEKAA